MLEPTFDRDGYPTDETLRAIENWPLHDWRGFIKFVICAWSDYGTATIVGTRLRLATGGWSGNEDIHAAMCRNFVVRSLMWESSHRGGLHWYDIREWARVYYRESLKKAREVAE